MIPYRPPEEILRQLKKFSEAWCDRRCFTALRYLLRAWPLASLMTDAWGELGIELQNIRAFARDEQTPNELAEVEQLIRDIDKIVHRT